MSAAEDQRPLSPNSVDEIVASIRDGIKGRGQSAQGEKAYSSRDRHLVLSDSSDSSRELFHMQDRQGIDKDKTTRSNDKRGLTFLQSRHQQAQDLPTVGKPTAAVALEPSWFDENAEEGSIDSDASVLFGTAAEALYSRAAVAERQPIGPAYTEAVGSRRDGNSSARTHHVVKIRNDSSSKPIGQVKPKKSDAITGISSVAAVTSAATLPLNLVPHGSAPSDPRVFSAMKSRTDLCQACDSLERSIRVAHRSSRRAAARSERARNARSKLRQEHREAAQLLIARGRLPVALESDATATSGPRSTDPLWQGVLQLSIEGSRDSIPSTAGASRDKLQKGLASGDTELFTHSASEAAALAAAVPWAAPTYPQAALVGSAAGKAAPRLAMQERALALHTSAKRLDKGLASARRAAAAARQRRGQAAGEALEAALRLQASLGLEGDRGDFRPDDDTSNLQQIRPICSLLGLDVGRRGEGRERLEAALKRLGGRQAWLDAADRGAELASPGDGRGGEGGREGWLENMSWLLPGMTAEEADAVAASAGAISMDAGQSRADIASGRKDASSGTHEDTGKSAVTKWARRAAEAQERLERARAHLEAARAKLEVLKR